MIKSQTALPLMWMTQWQLLTGQWKNNGKTTTRKKGPGWNNNNDNNNKQQQQNNEDDGRQLQAIREPKQRKAQETLSTSLGPHV